MAEPEVAVGQAGDGLPEGATQAAPEGEGGQSGTAVQTTGNGPDTNAESVSFFDPKSVPEELMPAYKQMQAAYTKKAQEIAKYRDAFNIYSQFQANPHGSLQQLAQSYGYQLIQPGQQANPNEKWEPQTWDDVMNRAREEAKAAIMKDMEPVLKPVFEEVKNLRKSNIEKSLDDIDPNWRVYEDDMMQTLQEHPTLVKDPAKLYRMSVPADYLEAKATKAALEKLKGQAKASQVSGGSSTTKAPSQVRAARSFDEAVALAKQQLAEKGMRPPGGA